MKIPSIMLVAMVLPFSVWAQSSCPATMTVGFRVATIAGLKTAIWYPTTANESSYIYAGNLAVGSVALNAPASACARFPMVVFSHGFGGCGIQSVFITEQVARKGYIVAAPDHKDAGCSVDGSAGGFAILQAPYSSPEKWTDQTFVNRKNDITTLITGMLGHPEFGGAIDSEKIAGMGHSLGGYTIFGMTGGWPSWKEPRMKAAMLLSPYMDAYLVQGGVPRNTLPTMYQGGVMDTGNTPSIEKAGGVYDTAASPKFFVKLTGAHMMWTNTTCTTPTSQCLATSSVAQSIDSTVLAFLDHYVKGADRPELWFRTTNATVRAYRRSTKASIVSGASLLPVPLPSLSVGSALSEGLIDKTVTATGSTLPTTLGGLTVVVTDSAGTQRNAQLYMVSPNQVNFLVPPAVALGNARLDIRNATDNVATGAFSVAAAAPALFSATGDGSGTPAGKYRVVRPDGKTTEALLSTLSLAPEPLNVKSGQVYLTLYGTGFGNGTADSPIALVGNRSVPAFGVAASPDYPGLDQVTLGPLPPSLSGAGTVALTISIAGNTSNALTIAIR